MIQSRYVFESRRTEPPAFKSPGFQEEAKQASQANPYHFNHAYHTRSKHSKLCVARNHQSFGRSHLMPDQSIVYGLLAAHSVHGARRYKLELFAWSRSTTGDSHVSLASIRTWRPRHANLERRQLAGIGSLICATVDPCSGLATQSQNCEFGDDNLDALSAANDRMKARVPTGWKPYRRSYPARPFQIEV